jgi:hypothetical protein
MNFAVFMTTSSASAAARSGPVMEWRDAPSFARQRYGLGRASKASYVGGFAATYDRAVPADELRSQLNAAPG